MNDERLRRAVTAIDAANADDPNRVVVRGHEQTKEIAHAKLVTEWVRRLDPDPSESLLLAARAHHLRRWTVPRSSFPAGRAGYLRWRRRLHAQHAADVGDILAEVGYDTPTIERVQEIVAKRGLGTDPEVQVLEDALCLVFLETQLHDLAARLDPDKMVAVAAKTLHKMSPEGIALAGTIPLAADDQALLERAVEPAAQP
jgi:Domain of unknown function (DUF4202)